MDAEPAPESTSDGVVGTPLEPHLEAQATPVYSAWTSDLLFENLTKPAPDRWEYAALQLLHRHDHWFTELCTNPWFFRNVIRYGAWYGAANPLPMDAPLYAVDWQRLGYMLDEHMIVGTRPQLAVLEIACSLVSPFHRVKLGEELRQLFPYPPLVELVLTSLWECHVNHRAGRGPEPLATPDSGPQ